MGLASVETADITGFFEGELQISQRLLLRASGKISTKVRYREIEIELRRTRSRAIFKRIRRSQLIAGSFGTNPYLIGSRKARARDNRA